MKSSTEKNAAIHEAGHAVVGLLLGVLIEATIVPTNDDGGRVTFCLQESRKSTAREGRKITFFAMAGQAAEELYANESSNGFWVSVWLGETRHPRDTDGILIREMAEREMGSRLTEFPDWVVDQKTYEFDGEMHHYLAWLFERTKRFLSHPRIWKAINKVADALILTKTLSAEDVREICRPIFPCKPVKSGSVERTVAEFQRFFCFR